MAKSVLAQESDPSTLLHLNCTELLSYLGHEVLDVIFTRKPVLFSDLGSNKKTEMYRDAYYDSCKAMQFSQALYPSIVLEMFSLTFG